MTEDRWLARLVAVGLIVLAAVAVGSFTYLKAKGLDAPETVALASAAVGALAGFFAGVGFGKN